MIWRFYVCCTVCSIWIGGGQSLLAQTPISQYEFNSDLTNASSVLDKNGALPPDGLFREGLDSETALEGTPLFGLGVDGSPNGAILLDGHNDWIDVTTAGLPGESAKSGTFTGPGLVSGTVMTWIKVDSPANAQSRWLMGNANSGDFQAWRFGWSGAQLEAVPHAADISSQYNIADATHNIAWADGAWHQLAVSWDGVINEAKLYLDGEQLGDLISGSSLTGANTQTPWEFPMAIGARNNGGNLEGFWDGALDDLRVYAEALSESQISTIFENTPRAVLPDFDADNDVDGADFLIWQRGVDNGTTLAEGDANGNEQVDGIDLLIWQSAFGSFGEASTPQIAAVPEPATAMLLLAGVLAGLARTFRPSL
ncbi:MAG: LamG domain-containing protein [Pirellulales bacterium]